MPLLSILFPHPCFLFDTTPSEGNKKKEGGKDPTCAFKVSFSAPALLDLITQLLTGHPFWAANGKFDNGVRLFWSPHSRGSPALLLAMALC